MSQIAQPTILEDRQLASSKQQPLSMAAEVPVFGVRDGTNPTSHRGFMIQPADFLESNSRKEKLRELASWNVNIVRWQINVADGRSIKVQFEEAATQIESALADFGRAGIGIIVDFHPPQDAALMQNLARSPAAQSEYLTAWRNTANRFNNATSIVGYDVLNEPRMTVSSWKNLATRVVKSIREADDHTPIIIESVGGDPYNMKHLPIFNASMNVVYSFHMYAPPSYTHQGTPGPNGQRPTAVNFQGPIVTQMYRAMEEVKKWQLTLGNKPRVLVGEFSVVRDFQDVSDSDKDGDTQERIPVDKTTEYLRECIRTFEKNKWDWTYHAYDEAPQWDLKRGAAADLEVVKEHLKKNAVALADGMAIHLRAFNGMYLAAEWGGGGPVVANRTVPLSWETFRVVVVDTNRIALQAANGQYLAAEGGGGREIVANRNHTLSWETFTVVRVAGNKIALQAANGQWWCAEGGGGREVLANRNAVLGWETFEFSRTVLDD